MYGVASLIVTATVLPLLGLVAVCLRFFVRLRLKSTFVGIDDWLIAFSCLLVLGQGANQINGEGVKPLPPASGVKMTIMLTVIRSMKSGRHRRAW